MKLRKKKTKSIRRSKNAMDLVPTYPEYDTLFRKDKEKVFARVLDKTRPDDLSKDYMLNKLTSEQDIYRELQSRDSIVAEDTAYKILLLQESDVQCLKFLMKEEEELQKYISDKFNKGGLQNERKRS